MYCKRCGATITGKEEFCATCGEKVAEPLPPVADTAGLRGVGGWLLLLCIVLTIVFPLNILYGTVRSLSYHPDALVLLLNAINIGLGGLSLAAGVMLWQMRKNAVMVAKIFLVASPLHAIGILCLVVFSGHMNTGPSLVALAIRILALPFLVSFLFYWYLSASKRVKSAYTAR